MSCPLVPPSPRCSAIARPKTTAAASSSESINGGRRVPGRSRYPPPTPGCRQPGCPGRGGRPRNDGPSARSRPARSQPRVRRGRADAASSSRNAISRDAGREMPRFKHDCGQKVTARAPTVASSPDPGGTELMAQKPDSWSDEDDDDGRHDFDFFFGSWQQANRKRVKPLVEGDTEWVEFESSKRGGPDPRRPREHRHVQGAAVPRQARVRRILAAAVRARDRSLADLVGLDGRQRPARPAGASAGSATASACSSATTSIDGVPVKVRFTWKDITPDSATWEQSFSFDDGEHLGHQLDHGTRSNRGARSRRVSVDYQPFVRSTRSGRLTRTRASTVT